MKTGKCEECKSVGPLVRWVHPPICEACHDLEDLDLEDYIRFGGGLGDLGSMDDTNTGGLGTNSPFSAKLASAMRKRGILNDRPVNPNNKEWLFGRGVERQPDRD
jgi:hypothetical protein